MIARIKRPNVEKVLSFHGGYIRTRHAFRETDSETHTKQLGLGDKIPDGWECYSAFEFKGQSDWGAFHIPEKPGNYVFIMDDAWDTKERYRWD